ncbi:MAG TPA: outer membrane beta-barrel protein [Bacteroidia bacterium]|nr:outer membrane beta-barrel protein [Bacteroidia bacterium]
MKKILLLSLIILNYTNIFAFKDKVQYGISLFGGSNASQLSGGSDLAHAGFYKHNFGTASLNFHGRYFVDDKWSLQTGIGFTSIGFEFGFAKNYSLIKNDHFIKSTASINVTQIPLLLIYNFKPDCKKKSWVVGAGFNFMFSDKAVNTVIYPEQSKNESIYLPQLTNFSQTVTAGKFSTTNLQLMVGREKKFNKGNRLSFNFVWNISMAGDIAQSKVNYTLDGTDYEHIFSNQGHYAGFSIAYLFSTKSTRAKAEMLKSL